MSEIKYINKDFDKLRRTLINFTKQYFPNTYNDFTEDGTGMLFMEQSAYIGDVLYDCETVQYIKVAIPDVLIKFI